MFATEKDIFFDAVRRDDAAFVSWYQSTRPDLFMLPSISWVENPLHVACEHGTYRVAQLLSRLNPGFATTRNQDGYTALHLACARGHLQVVELLLGLDSELCISKLCFAKDKFSMIPLQTAIMNGYGDVIKALITACPTSVGHLTSKGETLFHLAVKTYQINAFKVLLEEIKKLNLEHLLQRKDRQGNNVLHMAVATKQIEIVRLMLSRSSTGRTLVRVNSLNKRSLTAVDLCNKNPWDILNGQICKILFEAGGVEGCSLPMSARLRWTLETITVVLVVLGIVSGAVFTVICNLPAPFLKDNHAEGATFLAIDVLSYKLPPILYLLVFNTAILTATVGAIVVLLWPLPLRPVMVFVTITIGIVYAHLVHNVMPKFVVMFVTYKIPSSILVGVLAAAFISIAAGAYHIVTYLHFVGAQIFSAGS